MAFIGSSPETQNFIPGLDYFSGNGSTTAFTLSRPVASVAQIQVVIENVPQNPSTAYTVSGNTITFTSAPPSGTNNIYVEYVSTITQTVAPSPKTVGINQLSATGTPDSSVFLRGDNTWAAAAAPSFPSGTIMLFVQSAAPTGWTKSTTHDNKALRVVSGAASSGGSVTFTTAFASQAVSGTVGATTLTTSQIPAHGHTFSGSTGTMSADHSHAMSGTYQVYGSPNISAVLTAISSQNTGGASANHTHAFSGTTANAGSGGSHDHTFTGTAINLAVQYVDVIIATKD